MKKILAILLVLLSTGMLYSQAGDSKAEEAPEVHKFVIKEIHYITDKYTRESALERELNIHVGTSFNSIEELEKYLEDKAQHLWNLRVLEDVQYSYEKMDGGTDEETGITVAYEVTGSWTFYPIGYPKYDSNTGFRLGAQFHYDNFFGTLTKVYLGSNIDIRSDDGDYVIPQWSLNPKISNITFGRFTFDLNLFQQYKEITKYNTDTEEYEEYYTRHSTALDLETAINLPWDLYYSFGPSFEWFYGYEDQLENNGSNIEKEDLQFSFSHAVGLDNLNWQGNFRQGTAVKLGHTIAWAQELEDNGKFKTSITGSAKAFYIWKRLNPSVQVSGVYSFNEELSGLGDTLRGIREEDMYGIAALYMNTSMNISVIPWKGVGEALCQPFFDWGVAFKEDESWDTERDMKYSAGADFILYLDALKSLVARGMIGIDLTNPDWSDGRKYEITIESELHY